MEREVHISGGKEEITSLLRGLLARFEKYGQSSTTIEGNGEDSLYLSLEVCDADETILTPLVEF